MRSAAAVSLLLVSFSAVAGSSSDPPPVPLRGPQEAETLHTLGYELTKHLGLEAIVCPPSVVDRRSLSFVSCGSVAKDRAVEELTAAIDEYLLADRLARITDTAWTKKKDSMVRVYSIGGTPVTVKVSAKLGVVAVSYPKQCLRPTLPAPQRVGELVTDPRVVRKKTPRYPEPAQSRRVEAELVLQVMVRADGTVGETCVLDNNSPGMGFEDAAVEAIKKWRYEPARLNGEPVAVPFFVFVSFRFH